MNQVGQVLNMAGTLTSGHKPYAWVWSFWDGETAATKSPFYQKVFNQGGTLSFSVRAVDDSGAFTENTGSAVVNAPPEITQLFVSNNDSPAPYETTVQATFIDPDNAGDLTVYFGNQGTVMPNGSEFFFTETITEPRTITLSGTDQGGGVTTIPLDFRVAPPPGIFLTGQTDTPIARIGPGKTISVGALASEQYNAPITSFEWELTTANGWSTNIVYTSGTSPASALTNLGGGAYQSSVDIPISSETEGPKVIILTAFTGSGSKSINVPITLIYNQAPVINAFEFSGSIADGLPATLGVDAFDAEGDVLSYRWSLTIPNTIAYGNPISVIADGSVFEGSITVSDSFGASITRVIPKILITSQLQVTAVQGSAFSYQLTAMGRGTITYAVTGLPAGLSISNGLITGIPSQFGSVDMTVSAQNSDGTDIRTLRIDVLQEAPPPPPPENLNVTGFTSTQVYVDQVITQEITIPATYSDNARINALLTKLYGSTTTTTVVVGTQTVLAEIPIVTGTGVNVTTFTQLSGSYVSGQDLIVAFKLVNDISTLPDPSGEIEMRTAAGVLVTTLPVSTLNSDDTGQFAYLITNATIQSIYGGQPSLIMRVYSVRSGVRSQLYQEAVITRL